MFPSHFTVWCCEMPYIIVTNIESRQCCSANSNCYCDCVLCTNNRKHARLSQQLLKFRYNTSSYKSVERLLCEDDNYHLTSLTRQRSIHRKPAPATSVSFWKRVFKKSDSVDQILVKRENCVSSRWRRKKRYVYKIKLTCWKCVSVVRKADRGSPSQCFTHLFWRLD